MVMRQSDQEHQYIDPETKKKIPAEVLKTYNRFFYKFCRIAKIHNGLVDEERLPEPKIGPITAIQMQRDHLTDKFRMSKPAISQGHVGLVQEADFWTDSGAMVIEQDVLRKLKLYAVTFNWEG